LSTVEVIADLWTLSFRYYSIKRMWAIAHPGSAALGRGSGSGALASVVTAGRGGEC